MAVTDYKYAGTAENVDRSGSNAWSNADYAKADDTSYAKMFLDMKNVPSDWLLLTNFGFTSTDLPSGCTINGIELIISRAADLTNAYYDSALYLYNNGAIGNNLASATKWPLNTQTEATYGGATNMCGTTLTQSDIISTAFGISLSCVTASQSYSGYVDYIKIRVYYTAGGGAAAKSYYYQMNQ